MLTERKGSLAKYSLVEISPCKIIFYFLFSLINQNDSIPQPNFFKKTFNNSPICLENDLLN